MSRLQKKNEKSKHLFAAMFRGAVRLSPIRTIRGSDTLISFKQIG